MNHGADIFHITNIEVIVVLVSVDAIISYVEVMDIIRRSHGSTGRPTVQGHTEEGSSVSGQRNQPIVRT